MKRLKQKHASTLQTRWPARAVAGVWGLALNEYTKVILAQPKLAFVVMGYPITYSLESKYPKYNKQNNQTKYNKTQTNDNTNENKKHNKTRTTNKTKNTNRQQQRG